MKPIPDLSEARWQSGAEEGTTGGVEIAFVDDVIVMRDAKDPTGPVLVFTRSEWDAFLAGARDNEFDLP
ncbi:MAG TPA: DUF397 domain-containing protein [Mycobacteriales bacterium]|jgi:Domain of unknown function (DUF397).